MKILILDLDRVSNKFEVLRDEVVGVLTESCVEIRYVDKYVKY